jgi:hypothetical protein
MAKKNAANVFVSIETLATLFPFYAQQTNETLPFVTIRDYETMTKGIRNISRATTVAYTPLLHNQADVTAWNRYCTSRTDWILNGRQYLDENDEKLYLYKGEPEKDSSTSIVPYVYDWNYALKRPEPVVVDYDNGPFAPMWQMTPVPPVLTMINSNMGRFFACEMQQAARTGRPVLTKATDAQKYYIIPAQGAVSILVQPIFNGFVNDANRTVVAYLYVMLAWKYFFDNILAEHQPDLIVVVQNGDTNNTFRVNGVTTHYLGVGDLHDVEYNHMSVTQDFVAFEESAGNCSLRHRVHVFPTKALEEAHTTGKPALYAFVSASIFAFAALVFVVYDCFVTNRQSRTELRANKSNAIVQELFPGNVATQLFATQQEGTASRRSSFQGGEQEKIDRGTIADFYPESTVLCKYPFVTIRGNIEMPV